MNTLSKNFEGIFNPDSVEIGLIARLDSQRLPAHVAVIMDGNGRWAKRRKLPRVAGHRAGITAVKATVETCARLTVPVLTLYAFSAENWKRPVGEINMLMKLLQEYLKRELPTIQKNDICFQSIGRIGELPLEVRKELSHVHEETRHNRGMKLVVALNYGSRLELVDAVNKLLKQGSRYPIEEEDISKQLYTCQLPDPDLLIRTSGEMRISNFMLWQIAYSEIYITDVLWPDFRGLHFLQALVEFQKRERRYGGIQSTPLQKTS